MQTILAFFGRPGLLSFTLLRFVHWYFVEEPQRIVRRIFEYLGALMEIFSFVFLVRTLLSPWKAIGDEYPDRGFNLQVILETLTLNLTSRVIGMIFRVVVLVFGLVVVVIFSVASVLFFFTWILFPVLVVLLPSLLL